MLKEHGSFQDWSSLKTRLLNGRLWPPAIQTQMFLRSICLIFAKPYWELEVRLSPSIDRWRQNSTRFDRPSHTFSSRPSQRCPLWSSSIDRYKGDMLALPRFTCTSSSRAIDSRSEITSLRLGLTSYTAYSKVKVWYSTVKWEECDSFCIDSHTLSNTDRCLYCAFLHWLSLNPTTSWGSLTNW